MQLDGLRVPIQSLILPPRLRQLDLGFRFNEPVDGWCVPEGLEELEFSYAFNQPLENVRWCSTLTSLHLGGSFSHSLKGDFAWPASLRKLVIPCQLSHPLADAVFPPSLTHLKVDCSKDATYHAMQLPAGLEELRFTRSWLLDFDSSLLGKLALPRNLRVLRLPNLAQLNFDGVVLPLTLEELVFGILERQLVAPSLGVRSLMSLVIPPSMLEVTLPDPGHIRLRYEDDAERTAYCAWLDTIELRPNCQVKRLRWFRP